MGTARPGAGIAFVLLSIVCSLQLTATPAGGSPEAVGPEAPEVVTCANCPPIGVQNGFFTGTRSEALHGSRSGVPTNCPGEPFPGTVGGLYFWYETYVYENLGPAACIRVIWDPNAGALPCGYDAHAKLYAPSYDPDNQQTGFLGRAGTNGRYNFRAVVPADSAFALVVENTDSAVFCTYAFEIVDVPCQPEADEHIGDFDGGYPNYQDGRLFRDGVVSTCGNKAFPGVFDEGNTFSYETVTRINAGTALCYEVEFNPQQCPNPCGSGAHASVYSPSYDPGNLSLGYLGDAGGTGPRSFYATVPAASPFEVAVNTTEGTVVCTYSVRVKPSVFGDGFDHGDALGWSTVVP